jgi:hypothetical protein
MDPLLVALASLIFVVVVAVVVTRLFQAKVKEVGEEEVGARLTQGTECRLPWARFSRPALSWATSLVRLSVPVTLAALRASHWQASPGSRTASGMTGRRRAGALEIALVNDA